MKIARYLADGSPRYGIVEHGTVYQADGDLFEGLSKGAEVGSIDSLTLLPPVEPSKIVAIGLNYALHVTENDPNRTVPTEPVIFMKPQSALLGHGGVIELPVANRIDHEAELCIVIGKTASRVSEAAALDYVLGFTCGNDVSHRDFQRKDGQWVRAKGFDTFAPLGPVIETDVDVSNLAIQARLNGEVKQSSNTNNMIFKPAFLVSFVSEVMTLLPGDVIMTGTPEGVSPMQAGDTIEVEIEGIGTLRNTTRARD
ncbi:MAG TPA: fumarylacetoacetate hydrolase family protein [Nitrolancea sp.]|nr:fumarylacetoacetate hydrolase family protein [Nitrolancea sp.]